MNIHVRSIERRLRALEDSKSHHLLDEETFGVVEADWPCGLEKRAQWAKDLALWLELPPRTSLYVRKGGASIPLRIIIAPNLLANMSAADETELWRTAAGPMLLVMTASDDLIAAFDAPNGYYALMDECAAEMGTTTNARLA